ncbi:hypothetical protein ZWY2020_010617 [Hordeum vulgare]|nr:hypothetical protein ZWY2020_010617 [Hordeum vulgare]
MTFTQRSESMNRILKKSFVREKHDLHLFAEQVDNCIHARRAVEDEETVANEAQVKTTTQFGLEVQLSKVPKGLCLLLQEEKLYTFVGFSIEGDKRMPKESGLEIKPNKYIDMQRKWSFLFLGRKKFHSLANVAGNVIHPFYKHMKYKINREEDHKLWGISQQSDYLIEYATIDAYATYESWKRIENISEGLEFSEAKEAEAKEDDDNGYYGGGY